MPFLKPDDSQFEIEHYEFAPSSTLNQRSFVKEEPIKDPKTVFLPELPPILAHEHPGAPKRVAKNQSSTPSSTLQLDPLKSLSSRPLLVCLQDCPPLRHFNTACAHKVQYIAMHDTLLLPPACPIVTCVLQVLGGLWQRRIFHLFNVHEVAQAAPEASTRGMFHLPHPV